jgi:hypothetical protein
MTFLFINYERLTGDTTNQLNQSSSNKLFYFKPKQIKEENIKAIFAENFEWKKFNFLKSIVVS